MSERSKYLDVVLKLNRLTQDGKLRWTHHSESLRRVAGAQVEERYSAKQGDKSFMLLKAHPAALGSQPELSINPLTEVMARRPVLQVLSDEEPIFTFPPMSAIDDLYDTVALNNEEVEAFFNDFLSEEG